MNQNNIDFCNYIQPILNSCFGFMKTDGYVTHIPGVLIVMDDSEMSCGIIHIPVIYDVYFTAKINEFMTLKTDEQKSEFYNLYFTGWNIKRDHLLKYYNLFDNIDNISRCIYYEPDCFNIPKFSDTLESTDISSINVSDGYINYRVPSSKSITSVSKSDTASLKIYDCVYNPNAFNNVKTIKYTVYKKKFKLSIDIFSNILIV